MSRASWMRVLLALGWMAAACASPRTLTDEGRRSLSGTKLAGVASAPASLSFDSPGGAAASALLGPAGAIGAAAGAKSDGERFAATHGIEDPAAEVREALAARLQESLSVQYVGVQAPGAGAKYALEVKTLLWRVFYLPLSGGKYGIQYQASMKLVDTAGDLAIAQGECLFSPIYGKSSPTYDELVADGASRLKLEFSKAVSHCVNELSPRLGLPVDSAAAASSDAQPAP